MTARDFKADMKAALIQEYEAYVRGGREADAEGVAAVLKDEYGHEVSDSGDEKMAPATPERADVEKPPEAAVEQKPRRGRPPKTAGDRAGE